MEREAAMRLNRLDLTRYGKFTDKSFSFGPAPAPGDIDFHILYGPNEAGKSTAFEALLDLLFGIEAKSRYAFLHPYSTMQIGGALEWGGRAREFIRVKRNQNSLLDGTQQPVPQGVLQAALGGIDRASYKNMFSLDDESIEKGGESILSSDGDLGQLLFSASSGLASLSQRLLDLRAETERFYKKSAKATALSQLKTQLADLRTKRDSLDTMAAAYGQEREQGERARGQYETALAERGEVQRQLADLQICLQMTPRLHAWRRLIDQFAPLADLPAPPAEWAAEFTMLQTNETTLATEEAGLNARMERMRAERDLLVADGAIADLYAGFDALSPKKDRYTSALTDIPKRQDDIIAAEVKLSEILVRIGRRNDATPRDLVLSAETIQTLRDLIEKRAAVVTSVDSAKEEVDDAEDRVADAFDLVTASGGSADEAEDQSEAIAALREIVTALKADDPLARKKLALTNHNQQQQTTTERIEKLRPWTGTIDDLWKMDVPGADIVKEWKSNLVSAKAEVSRTEAECMRLGKEIDRLKAELAAIEISAGGVSDDEAARVRGERDAAWQIHRKRLDEETAEDFEAALRKDDSLVAARFSHSQDLAKLHQLRQSLTLQQSGFDRSEQERSAATEAHEALDKRISAAIATMSPQLAGKTVEEIETWVGWRELALSNRSPARAAELSLAEANEGIAKAMARLRAALTALNVTCQPDADYLLLLAQAGAIVDAHSERAQLRSALAERKRELAARQRKKKSADEAEAAWAESWKEACASCWIGNDRTPSVAVVREILAEIVKLEPALDERDDLQYRRAAMEQEKRDFEHEVAGLAVLLGLDGSQDAPLVLYQKAIDRAKKESETRTKRAEKDRELKELATTEQTLRGRREAHDRRKGEMQDFFGVASLDDVRQKLEAVSKRDEWAKQIQDIETEILTALGVQSMDEACSRLDGSDPVELNQKVSEFSRRFEDLDALSRELFSEHRAAVAALASVGGDDAIVLIESERKTIQLQIEEEAQSYLRSRLGVAAAEQALRHYRNLHQSSMMTRASKAFNTISRGAYPSLATRSEKDREVLIATAAEGGSKVASELSKGTRFQLYLALRVAGYFEFAQSRDTVPFIGDDIMETFDDFRAEEALGLFGEMAKNGQVIYMTHHQHLCAIAEKICPGVKIQSFE